MFYKKLLISCVVSSLLLGAEGEYKVDFLENIDGAIKPSFDLSMSNTPIENFMRWKKDIGLLILKPSIPATDPTKPVKAIFKSPIADGSKENGTLILGTFKYVNTKLDDANDKNLFDEENLPQKVDDSLGISTLILSNDTTNAFRKFVLGGGNVDLYSGTNLEVSGFKETELKGTININAGTLFYKTSSSSFTTANYGTQASSLSINSDKDYSVLNIGSSLYLNTNTSLERTREKSKASFNAEIKGNISLSGYTKVYDKAKLTLKAGNRLSVSSSLYIDPQEMRKIIQDELGNQSISEADRVKEVNLILQAPRIDLNGSLYLGSSAREAVYEKKQNANGTYTETIRQMPTDVGTKAEITADIDGKQISQGEAPSKDWEVKKAQILQDRGNLTIGKNSEAIIRVINNKPTDAKDKIFGEATKDDPNAPYAITLSNITIEDQNEADSNMGGNGAFRNDGSEINGHTRVANLSIKAQLRESNSKPNDIYTTSAGAGKVLFQGKVELGKSGRAEIEAYDGFVLDKNASFILGKDSSITLSAGGNEQTLDNVGKIEAKGGAFVLGYKGSAKAQNETTYQGKLTLKNANVILISDSKRYVTQDNGVHPNPPYPNDTDQKPTQKPEKIELEPAGIFLLGNENILENRSSLIFDGFGNLSTMTSREDLAQRSLEINNGIGKDGLPLNKKGIIDVRGSGNTIVSNGNISISSQEILLKDKVVQEGSGSDKKDVTYKGELIIKTISPYFRGDVTRIAFGSERLVSGRDRVNILGGKLKIEGKGARVDSYNLRLVDSTLDLSGLMQSDEIQARSGGMFVNQRRLELGGNVVVYVPDRQGVFINGSERDDSNHLNPNPPKDEFEDNKRLVMKVEGRNKILPQPTETVQTKNSLDYFSFKNHTNLELSSGALLEIGGDFYNSGTTIFKYDRFGVGAILVDRDIIFDMSRHLMQEDDDKNLIAPTVNPLIAINHSDTYSLRLDTPYALFASSNGMIQYQVKDKIYLADGKSDDSELSYNKLQSYLKKEMEDYLNGVGVYEGNENKLGVFLKGEAVINERALGFQLKRSDAITSVKPIAGPTGTIEAYFDILAKEGNETQARVEEARLILTANNAMKVLNNALESKNSLEAGILRDIGALNLGNLLQVANAIDTSMQAMTDIKKPLVEDFQKMQIIREIAVQNRLMRFSNPYVAEIELAQLIQNISANRYAQAEISNQVQNNAAPKSDISSDALSAFASYLPQDGDLSLKHGFWVSAITSTTKEPSSTSTLYGLNAGYEYAPIANVLLGAYIAYGYSDFKGLNLKNNAHDVDLTIYTRLYYENSEVDLTLGFMQAFNSMSIENTQLASQKLSFRSNAFDFSVKYGYVIPIRQVKGLFIKPQGSYTIYGVNIPELSGDSTASIVREKQLSGGMIFNLGAEIRQYVSAYSFLYLLPSFEYNLMGKEAINVSFVGAKNKLPYTSHNQASGLFSLYAGGEGYISPNFSLNLSAGYKAGLDQEEHNISISAGLKFKF